MDTLYDIVSTSDYKSIYNSGYEASNTPDIEYDTKFIDLISSTKKCEITHNHMSTVSNIIDKKICTIDDACSLARNWLPPITQTDKINVMNILTGTEAAFGTPLLRKYIELLRPYVDILGLSGNNNKPREADCVASGIVFFYGCLFYIMHFPGWGRHIEDIFLYNLLYILVDHYIDDIHVDYHLKDQAISQMFMLIMDPLSYKNMSLIDPVLKTIAITYHKLISRCPTAQSSIIKLFKAEIEGLAIQKNNSLNRTIYYDIALRKGGYTMRVLQDIVGDDDPTISESSFHIGTIMQLIDDSADVLADMKNGIHTIATHDLQVKSNLDELWIDIMDRIANIDPRFTIFIILYVIFAVYLPDRMCNSYTDKLRSNTNPINLFDYNLGCDGSGLIVNAVISELTI